ncbi:MAG TPA: hypothetical protein VE665_09835 [Hyphomicrobiaceae bacterium]|jgi:hypothetical protein|nr:hypothetical protein [Hyphomicrobiaceae bacterium]
MYGIGALTVRSSSALLAVSLVGMGILPNQGVAQLSSIFTFQDDQIGALPKGFQCGMTGQWKATEWSVLDFQNTRVLGHFGFWEEDPDGVYPVCWVRDSQAKDLTLTVQLFPVRPPTGVKNAIHDGAGIVVRLKDRNNYYLMRAIPHEKLVRFYRVENGKRTTLGGKELEIELERWHELKLRVSGHTFTLFLNGENLFHLMDHTFEEAGSYGLWSKPNNVTYFDDLKVEVIP